MTARVPTNERAIPTATQNANRISRKSAKCEQYEGKAQQPVALREARDGPCRTSASLFQTLERRSPPAAKGPPRPPRCSWTASAISMRVLVGGPVDTSTYAAGCPSIAADQVDVAETVAHRRDLAQAHQGAVGAAEDDDLLEVLLRVVLTGRADPHLLFPRVDASRPRARASPRRTAPETSASVRPEGPQLRCCGTSIDISYSRTPLVST